MTLRQLADRVTLAVASRLTTVRQVAREPVVRMRTGLRWLDPMLGGGFVRGSVVMVHGEPGAGKSTALAQACAGIRGSVYVSMEEELSGVAARVLRLGLRDDMALLAEADLEMALTTCGTAPLIVIDSLQVMVGDAVAAVRLAVAHARAQRCCVVLVCHETKGGVPAGARTIEHLVDCSLRIGRGPPRYISTEKNRHGAAGIWLPLIMTERGMTG